MSAWKPNGGQPNWESDVLRARSSELIEISHPEFREELTSVSIAKKTRWLQWPLSTEIAVKSSM
jgi:hypothetical protein